MATAREHVQQAKALAALSIFGGFLVAGVLGPRIGPFSILPALGGVALGILLAVRGVGAARAANLQAQDERWGALGLVAEPYGSTGGLRYRGTYMGRGVDAYHLGYELYVSVAAATRSSAAVTSPKRAIGERLDLPPMHELPPLQGLPPGVVPWAESPAAMTAFLAQPGVQPILGQLFADARMPAMRRVWLAPGGVFLRDASAPLQPPEVARRMVEQLIHLAAAAERSQL